MNIETPAINVPKMVSTMMPPQRGDSYVVREGLLNNFYSLKVEPDEGRPIFRIEKAPPVILEGIAIIKKRFYHVTPDDLIRGVIRKSREINRENENGSTRTSQRSETPTDKFDEKIRVPDKSGAFEASILEESELVDSTWDDQVGALFDLIHSKEGGDIEIADSVQPRLIDEGSSVPNTHSDFE